MMAEPRSGDDIIVGVYECFTLPGDCKVKVYPTAAIQSQKNNLRL